MSIVVAFLMGLVVGVIVYADVIAILSLITKSRRPPHDTYAIYPSRLLVLDDGTVIDTHTTDRDIDRLVDALQREGAVEYMEDEP